MAIHSSHSALSMSLLLVLVAGCAPAAARRDTPDNSVVTGEDLEKHANEPIEQVLQRKVSGLTVTRTRDGGIALLVRGISSYDGSLTPPLYILNGMEMNVGSDGALTGVNPYDIDTIKVLKGAEAGIYGIRGANGVILITTKKGPSSKP